MAKDYWGLSSTPEADDGASADPSQPAPSTQHDQAENPPKPAAAPGHDQPIPNEPATVKQDLWASATDITEPELEQTPSPRESEQTAKDAWSAELHDPQTSDSYSSHESVETESLPLIDQSSDTTPAEEDQQPLAAESAEDIEETPESSSDESEPPKKRRRGRSSKKRAQSVPEGARKAKAERKTAIGPTFEVPRPGGRLRGGRKNHRILTGVLFFSVIGLLALALIAITAVVLVPKDVEAELSAQEKRDLRLDNYPTDAATAFAVRYATECLTFDSAEDKNREERRSRLAGFATSGVDQDCGWNGQGKQTVIGTPFWDGTSSPVEEWPENARWLGIQATVSTNDGPKHTVSLAVPVFTDDPSTGEKFKVVGEVGQVPLSAQADVPAREKPKVDSDLSRQLQDDLLSPYFTAWAASDTNVLDRYTAPNATDAARTGLDGTSGEPKVTLVSVYVPADASGDSYSWQVGDSAKADVTVDWTSDETTLTQSYRVNLTRADTGWFVTDIKGATVDPTGSED